MKHEFLDRHGRYFQAYSNDTPYGRYSIVVDEDVGTVTASYIRRGPNSETYGEIRPMKLSVASALNFAEILGWSRKDEQEKAT